MTLVASAAPVHAVATMRIGMVILFSVVAVFDPMFIRGQADDKKWELLNTIGVQLTDSGAYSLAELRFRSALVEAERFEERDYRLPATLSNLAFVCQERGELAEAEKLYRRVLALREKYLGPENPAVAGSLNNLAATLHILDRNAEADPLLRRALLIAEAVHDDNLIGSILNSLGVVLVDLGEAARAEPLVRRAMAIFDKMYGPDSFDAARTHNNLGTVYIAEGELGPAEAELTRAVTAYEKKLGPEHPLVGKVLVNLYAVLALEKRFEEGEPILRRALTVTEREAPESPRTQRLRLYLASLEIRKKNYLAAAELLKQIIHSEEQTPGPNSPELASVYKRYADVLRRLNQKTEAKRAGDRAHALLKTFR